MIIRSQYAGGSGTSTGGTPGGSTPPPPPPPPSPGGAPASLNELIGCMYGGYPDNLTGGFVGYKTNYTTNPPSGSNPPFAAHDLVARLPMYPPSTVDWSNGACNWLFNGGWASPGLGSRPYHNIWNHGFLIGSENRFYFEWTDITVHLLFGGWQLEPYPVPGAYDFWSSWINVIPGNLFHQAGNTVNVSPYTTAGGIHVTGVNMTGVTLANGDFLHCAPSHYMPRANASGCTAVSIQCYGRIRAFSGVDPKTIQFIAGFTGDTFAGAGDNTGNPALFFPRMKQLPTDGTPGLDGTSACSWRLLGGVQLSLADTIANPPPLVAYPT